MAVTEIALTDPPSDVEVNGAPRRFIRAVLGNRKAVAGGVILLVMVLVAAFPGLIAPDCTDMFEEIPRADSAMMVPS